MGPSPAPEHVTSSHDVPIVAGNDSARPAVVVSQLPATSPHRQFRPLRSDHGSEGVSQ